MEEQDIKDRILKGATELFLQYGIRSVSMDDVARHLSMSKKTLYHYFADKDEIVTIVADYHLSNDKKKYDEMRNSSKNAIEELVKISGCLKKDFQKMNPALLFDLQKYHAKAWTTWITHKQQYIGQSVMRNLKQGMKEGYFRAEIDVNVLAIARLEMIQMAFDNRIFPADLFNLAEVSTQLFEHFVQGILTDKGRKAYEKYKQQPNNFELIPQSL